MPQQISRTQTNINATPSQSTDAQQFQLNALKPHLARLRDHVQQGDFRARIGAQARSGVLSIPLWYGSARLQIPAGTTAVARVDVINGHITKLSIDLSQPVVLLNPVGSLVPDTIPGATMINSGTFTLTGMDLTPDGHIVPRGNIKMYFSVPIHKYIPTQFCPVINTDAMSFFKGKVIKSTGLGGGMKFNPRETLTALLRAVARYDVRSIFRPSRPVNKMNIECVDATLRGALQMAPNSDEFVSEPTDARVAITVDKRVHEARLTEPHVRLWPGGIAHVDANVHLQRAIPYAPLPPRPFDVDVALHQDGTCEVHAHGDELLEDLKDLRNDARAGH